jgi:hypothetical protein
MGNVVSDADGLFDFEEFNLISARRFYRVTFEP